MFTLWLFCTSRVIGDLNMKRHAQWRHNPFHQGLQKLQTWWVFGKFERRKRRNRAKVSAILELSHPVNLARLIIEFKRLDWGLHKRQLIIWNKAAFLLTTIFFKQCELIFCVIFFYLLWKQSLIKLEVHWSFSSWLLPLLKQVMKMCSVYRFISNKLIFIWKVYTKTRFETEATKTCFEAEA